MKLTKKYCPECGGEIVFTYAVPPATFAIKNGKYVGG